MATDPSELYVVRYDHQDRRLGRDVVHDPESRRYAADRSVDLPTRSFRHRYYNPRPNPDQPVGCCTGCDACVKANTAGNRVRGVTLNMDDALRIYSRASQIDPWPGSYPPDDTGSSGLAACKASKEFGIIARYEWLFGGVDQLVTRLRDKPVGVGAVWMWDMFNPDPVTGLVSLSGGDAGGHQWTAVGYNKKLDAVEGLCWWDGWGLNRSGLFRIRRRDLQTLLDLDGDAHITYRAGANG